MELCLFEVTFTHGVKKFVSKVVCSGSLHFPGAKSDVVSRGYRECACKELWYNGDTKPRNCTQCVRSSIVFRAFLAFLVPLRSANHMEYCGTMTIMFCGYFY